MGLPWRCFLGSHRTWNQNHRHEMQRAKGQERLGCNLTGLSVLCQDGRLCLVPPSLHRHQFPFLIFRWRTASKKTFLIWSEILPGFLVVSTVVNHLICLKKKKQQMKTNKNLLNKTKTSLLFHLCFPGFIYTILLKTLTMGAKHPLEFFSTYFSENNRILCFKSSVRLVC